ncbi:MAG: 1-acyl-sn-glycerol-3-phosphate acyltransferase [Alphaproteobacteria bacterium]|nr:1-acyl-sn-glycerol-3-phosphate acyltransferase [Alphaproteobacteria bacterium]
MQSVLRNLEEALKPRRQMRITPLRFKPFMPGVAWGDIMEPRPLGGRFRAIRRIVSAVIWTLIAIPIQCVLMLLPSQAKISFGCFYHRVLCWLIGLRVQVVGKVSDEPATLFLPNHSSWLDILVLGSVLRASFVSKSEVGQWPVIGFVAKLGRTVFVSRRRTSTVLREADTMRERLQTGDSLILFAEGTSNDGTRVLPFRSAFLAAAVDAKAVQPVSLVYDRLGGLPACRRDRPLFAWYGDMDIASHFWRITRRSGARATVLLHEVADPASLPDRKLLTAAVNDVVAAGAAQLRQNRPGTPLFLNAPR